MHQSNPGASPEPARTRADAAAASRFTYVYLASVEHSGSTVLACLLAAHPAISSVGEFGSDFPELGRCSCGSAYAECPFWKGWAALAAGDGIDFKIGNPQINLGTRKAGGLRERFFYYQFPWRQLDRLRDWVFGAGDPLHRGAATAIERSVHLAKLLCATEGTSVFLDTTKNPLQIKFLRRYTGVRLKLIALVRDGRGVMNSLVKNEAYSPDQAIASWLWGNRNIERAVAHYMNEADVFRLRLEDLWQDPVNVRRRLFEFLGVDPDVPLDYRDKSRRHIVGNRTRHVFDGSIRADESWRKELSEEHAALFRSRAGWLNRRYGYSRTE
jgi:hypothetical protein